MKSILKNLFFSLVTISIIVNGSFAANHSNKISHPPKILAASLLPVISSHSVIRIGINPNLSHVSSSLAKSMRKITVVTCYRGTCQFAKPRTGLGFWEATFNHQQLCFKQKKPAKVLVIACSTAGCAKKKLTLRIEKRYIAPPTKF